MMRNLIKTFLGKWFKYQTSRCWRRFYDLDEVESILFICLKPTGIGDALMNTPAYRAVRLNYPNTKISLITDKDILRGNPLFDEVILVRDWKEALKLKKKADLVILPNKNLLASFVAFKARKRFILGYLSSWQVTANFPTHKFLEFEKKYTHLYDMANKAVEPILSDPSDCTLVLEQLLYSQSELDRVKELISYKPEDKIVVLHPSGLWPSRTWTPNKYAELAIKLNTDGYKVVLNGAKEDQLYNMGIANQSFNSVIDLAGKINLYELAALFSLSKLAVLNDCGPMHIAVAAGVPVLTLWGPTHPHRRLPKHLLNKTCFYICPNGYCEDAYDFETPPKDHDRIKLITVNEVYDQAIMILRINEAVDSVIKKPKNI